MPRSKGKLPRKSGKGSTLSHKQRMFIEFYEQQGFCNATEAARRALYAQPAQAAYNVLVHPLVEAEVLKRREAAAAKAKPSEKMDRAWVLDFYKKWARAPEVLAKYKKIDPITGAVLWDFRGATQEELALITELHTETDFLKRGNKVDVLKQKFKVGTVDPKSAVDSAARVLGLNNDKLQLGGELSLVERLQRGRNRAAGNK